MEKIATITPVNCITEEQDGEAFAVYWEAENGCLIANLAGGQEESLGYDAETVEEAADIVYSLYATSNAYIYEPDEADV